MTDKCTKKLYDPESTLDPENSKYISERLKEGSVNKVPPQSGLFHSREAPKKFSRKKKPNEHVIEHGHAYLAFGTDGESITSGAGSSGATDAAAIDLMVGPMSSVASKMTLGAAVDPSFAADAARIYISQDTDIDKNFGLAEGIGGKDRKHRSGIGIKADGVRIIGREGVKIVTGPGHGSKGFPGGVEPNSKGGKLLPAGGKIDLIAGNFTEPRSVALCCGVGTEKIETLQPVPLGYNVADALYNLQYNVGHIWSALFALVAITIPKDAAIGIDPLRAWVPTAIGAATTPTLSQCLASLYHVRVNMLAWEKNYLTPGAYKYINSSNVSTT